MASGFPAPFDYFTRRPENILKLFKHVRCNRRDKSVESVLSKGSYTKPNNTRREQLQNLSEMRVISASSSSVEYERKFYIMLAEFIG